MNLDLYPNISLKDLSEIISHVISNNILDMTCISFLKLNDEYIGKKCKGDLKINLGSYNIGEFVRINVVGYNIIIKFPKRSRMGIEIKEKRKISSYIVYPEFPTIKIVDCNISNTSDNHVENVKLFFNLDGPYDIEEQENTIRKFYAFPKKDIDFLSKNKRYILVLVNNSIIPRIKIYESNLNIFIAYLKIDYPMPILIENKTVKL